MTRLGVYAVLLGAACSSNHNAAVDAPSADAPKQIDAAIDAQKPIDGPPVDAAPVYDFSCSGSALGSADSTITVSGSADSLGLGGLNAASGVSLAMFRSSDNTQVATTGPTGSDGAFAFDPQATDLQPLDVYIEGSDGSDRPSFVYPAQPLVHSFAGVPVAMISQSTASLISSAPGGAPLQPGDGLFVVQAVDCQGMTVTTAAVSVQQGGSNVGNIIDIGSLDSAFAGTFIVENVPPGNTTVSGTAGSDTFASHDVTSFADSDTETQIRP